MPGYDGTGPNGEGALTGGRRGDCRDGDSRRRPRRSDRRRVPRDGRGRNRR